MFLCLLIKLIPMVLISKTTLMLLLNVSLFIILLLLFWSEFFAEVPYTEPLSFFSIPFDVLHITIYSLFTQNYACCMVAITSFNLFESSFTSEIASTDLEIASAFSWVIVFRLSTAFAISSVVAACCSAAVAIFLI